MRRVIQWTTLLPFCLALVLTASAAQAWDDKAEATPKSRGGVDNLIYANLKEVINHGANLYNTGDWNGCYRLWEGSLMSIKPLLVHRPKLQEAIDTGVANARQDPLLYRRAWVLRTVLDQVRADIKGETPAAAPEPKDKPPVVVAPPKNKTLWDRLGGETGVARLVDDFLNAVVANPKVDIYRHGNVEVDAAQIAKMKREMVEQVSQVTGGPLKYTGPDMKQIHKDMGITNEQYNAAIGDLQKTLEKHKVADGDKKTILAAVNKYRKEIVQPKKPEAKKPEDKKPEVKKPLDKKPEIKKPLDKKPEDKKPLDNKPEIKKPLEKNPDGEKPTGAASIQGRVLSKGQPLAGGTIVFTSKAGKVEGKIAEDGTYKAEGAKPGAYKVSIDGVKDAAVPANYKDPKTSGLVLDIKDGQQTFDLQLQ